MHNMWVGIGAAALAAWIFGAVWYGVLGKTWQRAQGLDPEQCKGQKMPLVPMLASLLGVVIMAYVLRLLLAGLGLHTVQDALLTGLTIAVGFIVTTISVNNLFQQRSRALTIIDSLHWVGVVLIESAVLVLLG